MRLRFAPSPTGQLHVGNVAPPCSIGSSRAGLAACSFFASKTRTSSARPSNRKPGSSAICYVAWQLDWDERAGRGSENASLRTMPASRSGCTIYRVPARQRAAERRRRVSSASAQRNSSTSIWKAAVAEDPGPPATPGNVPRSSRARPPTRASRRGSGRQFASACPTIAMSRSATPSAADIRFPHRRHRRSRDHAYAEGTPAYNFAVVIDECVVDGDYTC